MSEFMSGTKGGDLTTKTSLAGTARPFILRLALAVAIVFLFAMLSRAGGPKCVAGTSYFASNATGQPLVWPAGVITYYTDQGNLSPILPNASANTFVANAFAVWTAVPTAAVAATSGGQLAEDVNGTNVTVNSNGTITIPADIQPTATGTPVGVVYDYDGTVTDAFLGAGAGNSSQCFTNAVYGGDDNYGSLATYEHALIVINGQCALTSSELTDVEYRLVRTIGEVLGLGWSQVNPNVMTGNPPATSDDFAGFPVMHYRDALACVPITDCFPNPYQLSADDVASLSRLYPVTAQNQSSFPGKQIFSSSTAGIHGSVWFTNTSGTPTEPMQGVNVVARWINPATGLPSGQYAVTAVSGLLFTGNAGNAITGFYDADGDAFSEWGSTNAALEGYFDLSGLPLPNGSPAQYQLSVEPIDTTWARGVGPYAPYQVNPSGTFSPLTVTVSAGQDVEQDVHMSATAQPVPAWSPSQTWTEPATIPAAGDWMGSLSGYGDAPYLSVSAQQNRTLSIAVTALDESGNPSEVKAQPVIGMWSASDPPGTAPPALTTSPFNAIPTATTMLNAQVNASGSFLIGISDFRGDGRPDYRYHASVLYADSVSPPRLSVRGGPVAITGTGFGSGLTVTVGSVTATPMALSAGQMTVSAPAQSDSQQSITVTNPTNGMSTVMTNALTYGAGPTDKILLLTGSNPSTPVGVQATNPVSLRVLASDGVTPVNGATVAWSASSGLQLSACSGTSSCSVISDQNGYAATWLTPTATGTSNITATLAPGAYSSSPSVQATLSATESSSDLGVSTPYLYIAQGANVSVPITARVLSNGVGQNNVGVNFRISSGSGTLSASSAQTNSSGYATVTLTLASFASSLQVNACVAPANAPCQQVYATAVAPSQLNLQPVAGAGQIAAGQTLQPVTARVVDSASPPHPVLAAPVQFLSTVFRSGGGSPSGGNGETNPTNPAMPVILSVSQSTVASDINGLTSITPLAASFSPPLEVDVAISAGSAAVLNDVLQLLPSLPEEYGLLPVIVPSVPASMRVPVNANEKMEE